jgi:hypothetical protein
MPNDNDQSLLKEHLSKLSADPEHIPHDILWRSFTHEEIEYLRDHEYPFLQIFNPSSPGVGVDVTPKFIIVDTSKWMIIDYGYAMASSSSYRKQKAKEDAEGDAESGDGGGTIIQQQNDTALAMIKEAQTRGWQAIEIIDGTELMKFYAWIAAQELGITIQNYHPNAEKERRYEFLRARGESFTANATKELAKNKDRKQKG